MANKDVKARDEHDREDEDDDDPDAGVPVAQASPAERRAAAKGAAARSASPLSARRAAAALPGKSAAKVAHGGGHGHGHVDATEDESQDPTWWTPYAALGVLVLVGVLGFFGTFNRVLKPLFSPMPQRSAHDLPAAAAPAAAPPAPATQAAAPGPAQPPTDTFGAKHVLVMHKESKRVPPGITRTKEEAMTRAKEALAKAKVAGAKFEEVVAAYSDEPNAAQRGGNLGNFRKGAMVKEFQEGLEKTKVGEISDIVETPFGYHVILRTK